MRKRFISTQKEAVPFDPNNQRAVIRASICTGETVAGFKNIHNGQFIEIMVIKTPEDLERFKRIYGITEIRKEY
ncbi:MAG TPA: aspartate dehydrogenase [Clostridiales bacterium]|nr:aspartate dehydrogenase [Clostridiales bacterium]HPP36828.1 aspartate dehydrogenase [Clostridiales bacterium]